MFWETKLKLSSIRIIRLSLIRNVDQKYVFLIEKHGLNKITMNFGHKRNKLMETSLTTLNDVCETCIYTVKTIPKMYSNTKSYWPNGLWCPLYMRMFLGSNLDVVYYFVFLHCFLSFCLHFCNDMNIAWINKIVGYVNRKFHTKNVFKYKALLAEWSVVSALHADVPEVETLYATYWFFCLFEVFVL